MKASHVKIISLLFVSTFFCLMATGKPVCAAPVPGIDVTYTSDADFDKGTLMNLEHTTAQDQLQLSDIITPFPFINIANSGRGTLVRIDVNSGVILGEYYTSPSGMGKNPSRTTVDQSGNVWVSNRDESGISGGTNKGSIARVGLIVGGTRVDADGSLNPTGQYLKPPFQYNTCADRNGDGLIKTSRAANNMLSWSNAGGADTHGGVTTADDECIINYTRVVATNTRTVAIDANNDIWVGGANTAHEKISGLTGQPVPGTQFNLGCGGYGGLVDKNGVLWSARFGTGLLRYDTKAMTGACLGKSKGDYGLGIDPNTGEIWHSFYSTKYVAKLAPDGTLLGKYSHGATYAQGVAVDKSGNVWVAHSTKGSNVGHLKTNGTFVGNISTGSGPTGVAVDANGKVWSTNYNSWTASRIDPNAGAAGGGGFKIGAVDKTVSLGSSAYPYNYSDMTGYVAIGGTSPQGAWSVVQDSGATGNSWGTVTWNREPQGSAPEGSIILVEARTSDSEAGLGSNGFTAVSNNQPFSLTGRYIEVKVTLKPNSAGDKPVLSDLRVSMTPISNVRVIDTISSGDIVINEDSFTLQPYSITHDIGKSMIEWRFDAFTIGQIQDLSYTVALKNPIPGEERLVAHQLEVLYTDINGNPVRNEIGPQYVKVLSSKYAPSITTDKQSYGAKQDVVLNAGVTNLSLFARTLDVKVAIEDSDGVIVKEVANFSGLQFAAGERKNFDNLVFNTGTYSAGNYRARLTLYEGQSPAGTVFTEFALSPDITVSSSIVTDRISYKPNEQATITAAVTNKGFNCNLENLTARVTILMPVPGGNVELYTSTKTLPVLTPGGSFSFKSYWNTGTNPAGTYLVTLEVRDSANNVLSTSVRDLVISSVTTPSALLKGQITLDKQSILTGEPVTVSYSVTNVGNQDLTDIPIKVQTIRMDEQAAYNTISDHANLLMGVTYASSGVIDTQSYSAKDYLVILRATIADVEETLVGTFFRVEGAPSAPALYSPANGSDVETLTPALTVSNASDPNDDQLVYEFEIYTDSGLTSLVTSATTSETSGVTAWTAVPLTENQTYFWRARAWDGQLYGPWMEPASFRVNTVNDLPTAPTISSPADGTDVDVLTPALIINNSSDADNANLTYNFEIALDPGFALPIAAVTGVESGLNTTSWTVPLPLKENEWYFWRAQADDWLDVGPWSEIARFQVNTANDAPSAPIVILPANDSTVAELSTDIVVSNSIDPDSTALTYYFEVDSTPTFDSAQVFRSGTIAEGHLTTLWHLDGLLENTRYFVRVKANDGSADSPWSMVSNFFASTVNDPPTTPTLANPSNGAGVSVFTPTLSVHDATDPDNDVLTYEFEVYADAAMTNLIARADTVAETAQITLWTLPVTLTENQICYWHARAFDGLLFSDWISTASFMVNTANDAPGVPTLSSPAEGSNVPTLTPTLAVVNAVDPDSDHLTYEFEIYSDATLVAASGSVQEDGTGITSWIPAISLVDNTDYQWRARAHDGDRYGPWMAKVAFTIHIPQTTITATIDFNPNTLNKSSNGKWVVVHIELPAGKKPTDIDISSIRLEGTIPAEMKPYCVGDYDKNGIQDLMVKFKRDEVIDLLPDGESVPVHVSGKVGSTPFEGVDVIRVIH